MPTRLVPLIAACGVAVIAAVGGFQLGARAGARDALLVAARSNLVMETKIAEAARQHGLTDALTRIDGHINSLVIELDQLSSAGSSDDQAATRAALKAVADHRTKFPDSSGLVDKNPSAQTVVGILGKYSTR